MVERIEHPGAVEHGAGGGGRTGEEELFREEQGIVGAEVGVAQERIEHELGTRKIFQAVKGQAAETVEGGGEVGRILIFLTQGGERKVEGDLVVLGGEVGLHAGEVESVERIAPLVRKGGEAGGERGLHGVDGEPREQNECGGVGGKIGEEGGEFALPSREVVGGAVGVEQIDPGTRAGGIVELAQEGVAAGFVGVAEVAVVAHEVEVELVALGKAGDLALEPEHGEIGVAAFPIAFCEEDGALKRVAEAPLAHDALSFVVAAPFEVSGGGLERDELMGADCVRLGRKQFLCEENEAFVFVGFEQQGEEQLEVVEIGAGECGAFGQGLHSEVGAAEVGLSVGEQAAAGDVVGHASQAGLEEAVAFAVVLSLEGLATGLEVMLAEAGAVVLFAPWIEGEVDVTGFGVAALEFYKCPDARGGAEPASEGEQGEGERDTAPENVIPDAIGCDDSDPEFAAIVGVTRTEGEEFLFGVIDHVLVRSARAG